MLNPDGGLVRGTLDVLILKALSWGPRHGYEGRGVDSRGQ